MSTLPSMKQNETTGFHFNFKATPFSALSCGPVPTNNEEGTCGFSQGPRFVQKEPVHIHPSLVTKQPVNHQFCTRAPAFKPTPTPAHRPLKDVNNKENWDPFQQRYTNAYRTNAAVGNNGSTGSEKLKSVSFGKRKQQESSWMGFGGPLVDITRAFDQSQNRTALQHQVPHILNSASTMTSTIPFTGFGWGGEPFAMDLQEREQQARAKRMYRGPVMSSDKTTEEEATMVLAPVPEEALAMVRRYQKEANKKALKAKAQTLVPPIRRSLSKMR